MRKEHGAQHLGVWLTFLLLQRTKLSAAYYWSIGTLESQFSQSQAADNLVCCSSRNVIQTLDLVGDTDYFKFEVFWDTNFKSIFGYDCVNKHVMMSVFLDQICSLWSKDWMICVMILLTLVWCLVMVGQFWAQKQCSRMKEKYCTHF